MVNYGLVDLFNPAYESGLFLYFYNKFRSYGGIKMGNIFDQDNPQVRQFSLPNLGNEGEPSPSKPSLPPVESQKAPGSTDEVLARVRAMRQQNGGDVPVAGSSRSARSGAPNAGKKPFWQNIFSGAGKGAKPKTSSVLSDKRLWIAVVGAVVLLVVVVVVLLSLGLKDGTSANGGVFSPSVPEEMLNQPPTSVQVVPDQVSEPTLPPMNLDIAPKANPMNGLWQQLKSQPVQEKSPTNKKIWDPDDIVGVIFLVILVFWASIEYMPRKGVQSRVKFFTLCGLVLAFLAIPVLNGLIDVSKAWTIVGLVLIVALLAIVIGGAVSEGDVTVLSLVFIVSAWYLYVFGKFTLPVALGDLVDKPGTVWQGVTDIPGYFILLITQRGEVAKLTGLIIILSIVGIGLAVSETGKKLGGGIGSLMVGVITLLVWWLVSLGLGKGVEYVLAQQVAPSALLLISLQIIKPVVALAVAMLIAVGIGVALGDTEIALKEVAVGIGIQKSSGFLQSVVDFLFLATAMALVFGVLLF